MITVLGGSFSRLHKGHKQMIAAAFNTGNKVIVGLSTDDYLKHNKAYEGYTYNRRKKALDRYMSKFGKDYQILPLDTSSGNTTTRSEYTAIVVSRETLHVAETINRRRIENKLEPLEIISVPIVLAEDLFPLSSSRIISGEIRASGTRVSPVRIGVATRNKLKQTTAADFFGGLMKNYSVEQVRDYELETDQPFGDDTTGYATRRAMEALKDRDYGIGIESGVRRDPVNGKYIEHHVCVVVDRYSRVTMGTSSGFELPEDIVTLMKDGMDESKAFHALYNKDGIGKKGGVIGEFSSGKLLRSELIRESLRNAFIPRLAAEYFGLDRKK